MAVLPGLDRGKTSELAQITPVRWSAAPLQALGLNSNALTAVQIEGTPVPPGLNFTAISCLVTAR
jgi:hypothetical protein